jgi:hypothetical protein
MKELNNIMMIVAACILAAAIFLRITEGSAGTALTLGSVFSMLFLMFNTGNKVLERGN